MNTKLVLVIISVSLGTAGIILTFAPDVVLSNLNIEINQPTLLLVQIIGGLYFGFSMLNWMVKEGRIGGIFNRPIVIANLSHFLIAGLALTKAWISNSNIPLLLLVVGVLNIAYGILFAFLLFTDPIQKK